jgi:hypothetical protein
MIGMREPWYKRQGYLTTEPKWRLLTRRGLNRRIDELHGYLQQQRAYSERCLQALSAEIKEPGSTAATSFYCAMSHHYPDGSGRCLVQCASCRERDDGHLARVQLSQSQWGKPGEKLG